MTDQTDIADAYIGDGSSVNCYAHQEVHAYYDQDKHSVLGSTQQIALQQLQTFIYALPTSLHAFKTLLDVGCGTGTMLAALTKLTDFDHVYGIDLSREMLEIAQSKLSKLNAICDSAAALRHYFPTATIDLLVLHFIFAYVEYKQLLAQTAQVVASNGLISIATTTNNSFRSLKKAGLTKVARIVCRWFNIDADAVLKEYFDLMPQDATDLIDTLQRQGYEVLCHETQHLKIQVANWREAWDFIHNAGWFVGALHEYKLTKWKIWLMFHLGKMTGVLPSQNGWVEDEMEIVTLTARRL